MDFKITQNNKDQILDALHSQISTALEAIGLEAQGDVINMAPVDTGRLKNSITHVVGESEVVIGTNVEYAVYQELGTSRIDAANDGRGYLRPAIEENLDKYKKIAESILRSF